MTARLGRRAFARSAAAMLAMPATAAAARPIVLKLSNDLPASHPMNDVLSRAAERLNAAQQGRLILRVFPSNQLGGDTDIMSQVLSGATEMALLSGNILSTIDPVLGIYNLPFVFPDDAAVWAAMDGGLGDHLRARLRGLGLHALFRHWDNGFRDITADGRPVLSPADLCGFKVRVPASPIWLSVFEALGAAPTPINWSDTYTALETHVVDGQENALALIETGRLFEVQRSVAMTNHIWDGPYCVANAGIWDGLPAEIRDAVAAALDAAALEERAALAALNAQLADRLAHQGLRIDRPDPSAFRQTLRDRGFYLEWKRRYPAEAWALLERVSGSLT